MLWSDVGERARRWLMEVRGLREETIRQARLGYVPGGFSEWQTMAGLSVPCGVLIPWLIDGDVWGLKVRRSTGKPKYQQVAGGKLAQGLYRVDQVESWHTVLIVEGEFDALVVAQTSRLVVPVALGSASNTLRAHWMGRLVCCPAIYARMDKDDSGQNAVRRLQAISERVRGVQVPDPHKDLNDYWLADGDGFRQWVRALEVLE
jgi:DNA primase